MELGDYLKILRRRWITILAVAAAVVALTSLWTFLQTPQYTSSTRLFVSTSEADTTEAYQGGLFAAQRVESYAQLVSSDQLAETVIEDQGLGSTSGQIRSGVTSKVLPQTNILEISFVDADPNFAQRVAQGYAQTMVDLVRELETPSGGGTAPVKASIVQDATLAGSPTSPQPLRNLGLGLILGLLLGVGAAVLRDLLDTTVKGPDDIADESDAPLLGSMAFDPVVKTDPLIRTLGSHHPRVEAFRVLRTNIQFVDIDADSKVFVVTSSVPAEGKTSTAANLALALSSAGVNTLLVECDLRRPRASRALDMDNAVGVTTVLLGTVSLTDAIQKDRKSGLSVLGSGATPPNPAELLQSRAMGELINDARQLYDVVLLDTPPLLPVADAAIMSSQADGAILVIRHGKTTKAQLNDSIARLEKVGGRLLGVVLNMIPHRSGTYGYGYGYGYAPDPLTPDRADGSGKEPVGKRSRTRTSRGARRKAQQDGLNA